MSFPFPRPVANAARIAAVAAAAAHDINNELAVIMGCCELALAETSPDEAIHTDLLELQRAAQRLTWKAAGLLHYASRHCGRVPSASMERVILDGAGQ